MSAGARVFLPGNHAVQLLKVASSCGAANPPLPPKPLLIASPTDEGDFPVLLLLHGYLLYNSFYSQLMRHIASHGFIVVAPQLYTISGSDTRGEVQSAASTAEWLPDGLPDVLPPSVRADVTRLGIAGHSRGGKVAFALLRGLVTKASLKFSAIIGIDPVDGMGEGRQTEPPVLTYVPHSLETGAAAMVIGSGLGELRKGALPACAPAGVNHRDFAAECPPPSCYLVAGDYGHLDLLDDVTPGLRGKATYCLCKSGGARAPMRSFVGGVTVAFLRAFLVGDDADLLGLQDHYPTLSPVHLTTATFLLQKDTLLVL